MTARLDSNSPLTFWFGTILVCLLALSLRAFTIYEGMPYFYDEDEAHHYNRTINMLKSGDLDPHYFHKPSLHFYMRLPAAWLGFQYAKRNGEISSWSDVQTSNQYGIAKYAFTASPQSMAEISRGFSVLISLLVVVFTALITRRATGSAAAAIGAALLSAVSPEMSRYAGVIGVDMLMSLLCLVSVYLAQRVVANFDRRWLAACGLATGLAISSKYNALPIAALPFFCCWITKHRGMRDLLLALFTPIAGFFIGSPYILISLPLFYEHFTYEVWHYAVAGHEGHTAERGLPQAWFYLNWLLRDACGPALFIAALGGLLLLLSRRRSVDLILLAFPLLYFLEMSLQRANFTRNMIVEIPFLAIAACVLLWEFARLLNSAVRPVFFAMASACIGLTPLMKARELRTESIGQLESRAILTEMLAGRPADPGRAVAGQLQLPPALLKGKRITTFDQEKADPIDLFQRGARQLYFAYKIPEQFIRSYIKSDTKLPGVTEPPRVIANPEIDFGNYNLDLDLIRALTEKSDCMECRVTFVAAPENDREFTCGDASENYCWTQRSLSKISFPRTLSGSKLKLTVKTPWSSQWIFLTDGEHKTAPLKVDPEEWRTIEIDLAAAQIKVLDRLFLYSQVIDSPKRAGINSDGRLLGIAIRGAEVAP